MPKAMPRRRTNQLGKKVEIAFVVVAGIENLKLTHEHVYWDQASVLVQLGLLDPQGLPVTGAESALKLLSDSSADS